MYVCMYVCTYVRMYVHMYVRMYACMYVRMYVCTYVCMYVCCLLYTSPSPRDTERTRMQLWACWQHLGIIYASACNDIRNYSTLICFGCPPLASLAPVLKKFVIKSMLTATCICCECWGC